MAYRMDSRRDPGPGDRRGVWYNAARHISYPHPSGAFVPAQSVAGAFAPVGTIDIWPGQNLTCDIWWDVRNTGSGPVQAGLIVQLWRAQTIFGFIEARDSPILQVGPTNLDVLDPDLEIYPPGGGTYLREPDSPYFSHETITPTVLPGAFHTGNPFGPPIIGPPAPFPPAIRLTLDGDAILRLQAPPFPIAVQGWNLLIYLLDLGSGRNVQRGNVDRAFRANRIAAPTMEAAGNPLVDITVR